MLWIDADAAFVRSDVDIRHEIGDKDLYLVIGEHVEPRPGGVVHRCDQPCTGFMLVRNCDWAEQFLREMWERREFTNHCWWELAAFINLAGVDRQYDEKMQDLGIKQLIALAEPSRNPRAAEEIAAHVGRSTCGGIALTNHWPLSRSTRSSGTTRAATVPLTLGWRWLIATISAFSTGICEQTCQ